MNVYEAMNFVDWLPVLILEQVLDNYGNAASDFIFEIGALNGKVTIPRLAFFPTPLPGPQSPLR